MRVISNKTLVDFAARYPDAGIPLQMWRRTIEAGFFACFADLKQAFNATDKAGKFYVFDIAGNKYRLIAAIHFDTQKLYVRHVLTHKEYDKWKP
ncbi:type II toxin-antitoxin system HigB family toxin [Paraburkholderia fungorum]|nr:type II toxin-antitoxin system HigB family toxin [Paraburkholderia fungorum]